MKTKTLLEQAKEVKSGRTTAINYSEERIELALAWIKDEISGKQLMTVISKAHENRGTLYNFVAIAIREGVRKGIIKL